MNVVYKVTNTINGKFYIGIQNTDDKNYLGSGVAIVKAVEKYGRENFTKEILHECSCKEETARLEAEIVTKDLVADPTCYNMKLGGMGGSMKGTTRPSRSEEYIAKQRNAKIGKKNHKHRGVIQTPWGAYESYDAAADACPEYITGGYIILACNKNNEKVINSLSVARSKGWLKEAHIGRTPKELGFALIK